MYTPDSDSCEWMTKPPYSWSRLNSFGLSRIGSGSRKPFGKNSFKK